MAIEPLNWKPGSYDIAIVGDDGEETTAEVSGLVDRQRLWAFFYDGEEKHTVVIHLPSKRAVVRFLGGAAAGGEAAKAFCARINNLTDWHRHYTTLSRDFALSLRLVFIATSLTGDGEPLGRSRNVFRLRQQQEQSDQIH
jgi:hypothetical protein